MKRDFDAENTEVSPTTLSISAALNRFLRAAVLLAFVLPMASCGTKTELMLPDGKPNPAGTKDPSQPPSPISR